AIIEVRIENGVPVGRIIPLDAQTANPAPIEGQAPSDLDMAYANGDEIAFRVANGTATEVEMRPYEPRAEAQPIVIDVEPTPAYSPSSPEARADAVARDMATGRFEAGFQPIRLPVEALPGRSMVDGSIRIDLTSIPSYVDPAVAMDLQRLVDAGVESIILLDGTTGLSEIVISPDMLASSEVGSVLTVDSSGETRFVSPLEAAGFVPTGGVDTAVLQNQAVTEFRSALEAAGIDIGEVNYDRMAEIAEKTTPELMRDYNLPRERAEALRLSARLFVQRTVYYQNLLVIAREMGMVVDASDAARLAETIQTEYANSRGLDLNRLFEFFRTPEGLEFLRTPEGQRFALQVRELEARHRAGQDVSAEVGGLLLSLGMFLGAERLADVLGIENPIAKTVFVLSLLHTGSEAQAAGLFTTPALRQAARGLYAAGQDLRALFTATEEAGSFAGLSNFRAFMMNNYRGAPLLFGRNSLVLRGMRQLVSREALGRFFGSIGQFQILGMGYDGVLEVTGQVDNPVLGHPVTKFIVPGIAMIAINRLLIRRFATSLLARAWTKAIPGVGIVLFVNDILYGARVAFADDYTRSLILREHDAPYDVSASILIPAQDCANATKSWMHIIGVLRTACLAADNYEGGPADAATFEHVRVNQFNHDEIRQLLLTLANDNADFRQAITALQMLDPPDIHDEYSDHGIRHAIDLVDRYFTSDGHFREELIDQFVDQELFYSFPADEEYRIAGETYNFSFSDQIEELSVTGTLMMNSREMQRVATLYEQEQGGQPLQYNDYDVAQGWVTPDGQLNHTSFTFQQFISSMVYNATHSDAPEAQALQTQIRLNIVRLRLEYLETGNIDTLRELDAWGDTINISAWEQQRPAMQALIGQIDAVDLDNPAAPLLLSGLVTNLPDFIPELSMELNEEHHTFLNEHRDDNVDIIRQEDMRQHPEEYEGPTISAA
ncbi:MAG: hypothetical protein PHT59_07190, partial [Candidatus Omnitrophica bacterium]|nr:hypothetical protein [Candidatus Omnitrophota bacterium]